MSTYDLIESHKDTKNSEFVITIPDYKGLKGNPVIWGKSYIPELQKSSGRLGRHSLFRKYLEEINSVKINSDRFLLDLDNKDPLDLWVKREENSALRNSYS